MLYTYQVGKPYHPSRKSWPEGTQYNFRGGEHELLVALATPNGSEVKDITRGQAEFALVVGEHVLFVLARFGGLDWMDAPYSWHRVPQEQRRDAISPGQMTESSRALLHVILIDADSGLVGGLRKVTLEPEMTGTLHAAIRRQADSPDPGRAYDAEINEYYRRYRATEDMLAAAVARCVGGK